MAAGGFPPTVIPVRSSYYQPGSSRAENVERLFNRIAPRYDLLNDLQSFGLHRLWKRQLVSLAAARPGERALDLCCGTGDIAFALAHQGAEVVGGDFSQAMLDVAAGRLREHPTVPGQGTVAFKRLDALRLPYGSNRFDLVTIAYGLRNLSDFSLGIAEIARVLRPGGRVFILDFGKPDNAVWRACYFQYLRFGVPVLGRMFAGDREAYSYILDSLQAYPGQRGVDQMLRDQGFRECGIQNFFGGIMSINAGRRD